MLTKRLVLPAVLRRPRLAWMLAALEVAVIAGVNLFDFPLSVPALQRATGHAYLDMCAFCSGSQVQGELLALGERGRLWQALLLPTIDVLIPVLSCLFGLAGLGALMAGRAARAQWLLTLPLLAMGLDFAENGTIVALLLQFPETSPLLARTEGVLSGLKFAAYGAVLVSMGALLVMRAASRRAVEVNS